MTTVSTSLQNMSSITLASLRSPLSKDSRVHGILHCQIVPMWMTQLKNSLIKILIFVGYKFLYNSDSHLIKATLISVGHHRDASKKTVSVSVYFYRSHRRIWNIIWNPLYSIIVNLVSGEVKGFMQLKAIMSKCIFVLINYLTNVIK